MLFRVGGEAEKICSGNNHVRRSYRVAQVSKPGARETGERDTPSPGTGEVLISVEACGICGADAADIDRADTAMRPPRVPGHEVVGPIAALGAGTPSIWKIGQARGTLQRMRPVPPG